MSKRAGLAGAPGAHWAFVPAGLLGAMLAGLGLLAAIAADDPGFAVENDYYKKAVAWDRELAQSAENARLDRRLALDARSVDHARTELLLAVRDARGMPLDGAEVRLEAFPNARSADRQELVLSRRGARYTGELALTRPGLWELRFTVTSGAERTTHVLRVDLPPKGTGT